jgi:NADH:ubiquinone oxidoreductase subunit E
MKSSLTIVCNLLLWFTLYTSAFVPATPSTARQPVFLSQSEDYNVAKQEIGTLDPSVAEKFKVVTCMSTSCSQKRKTLGQDSLATFGALYSRAKFGNAPDVRVEEGPCLGKCNEAPCVAIEHDDFIGSVSLEGMKDGEYADRV